MKPVVIFRHSDCGVHSLSGFPERRQGAITFAFIESLSSMADLIPNQHGLNWKIRLQWPVGQGISPYLAGEFSEDRPQQCGVGTRLIIVVAHNA